MNKFIKLFMITSGIIAGLLICFLMIANKYLWNLNHVKFICYCTLIILIWIIINVIVLFLVIKRSNKNINT